MEKTLVCGELRVLQRVSPYEYAVELDVMRDGPNVNNWDYRNIEDHYRTFAGTPILTAYVGRQVGDGHNHSVNIDPETGEEYDSYMGATDERIIGRISEQLTDLSLFKRDGYTWIRAKGILWRYYAPEAVDKLVRTGRMSVSAETNVLEEHQEGTVSVFTRWDGMAVTVLGDHVGPAIPGANIHTLAAMRETAKQMSLRVASLRAEGTNALPDEGAKPQNDEKKGVKTMYLSKKELEGLSGRFGDGYRVLSAAKDGDTLTVALLRRADLAPVRYELRGNAPLDPDGFRVCAAKVVLELEGQEVGCADACELMDNEMRDLRDSEKAASERACEAAARAEKAENALKEMEQRETARRVKASKEAAEDELRKINANRAEGARFDAELIAPVVNAAENAAYVGREDAEGGWCGDAEARRDVRDACMSRQMEMDRKSAELARNSANRHYAFEGDGAPASGDDWMRDYANN